MTNDKQRERLVELLKETRCERSCDGFKNIEVCNGCTAYERHAKSADYLLANGVIVPLCKVGQDIYRVTGGKVYGDWQIAYIEVYPDEIGFIDDSDNYFTEDHIGKDVFLTREEALKALGGVQG